MGVAAPWTHLDTLPVLGILSGLLQPLVEGVGSESTGMPQVGASVLESQWSFSAWDSEECPPAKPPPSRRDMGGPAPVGLSIFPEHSF